jgi:hypothetical protein
MSDEALADIAAVPLSLRGRVLTPSAKWAENGLFLLQFLLCAAIAFAPAILGGLAASRQLFPGNQALSFAPVVVGLGLTAGFAWVLGGWMLRKPWSADYLFRKAQAELLQRPGLIVDPNMPEAIFAEVVPRRNWGQIALQNAEDVGFLHLDTKRHQLLFEGDNKRYRIPARAVISCSVELMNPSAAHDPNGTPVSLVILKVRDRLGERELPLRAVRTVAGDPLGGNYMERADELQRRIISALSEVRVETPSLQHDRFAAKAPPLVRQGQPSMAAAGGMTLPQDPDHQSLAAVAKGGIDGALATRLDMAVRVQDRFRAAADAGPPPQPNVVRISVTAANGDWCSEVQRKLIDQGLEPEVAAQIARVAQTKVQQVALNGDGGPRPSWWRTILSFLSIKKRCR